jgi:hypothetical protein
LQPLVAKLQSSENELIKIWQPAVAKSNKKLGEVCHAIKTIP